MLPGPSRRAASDAELVQQARAGRRAAFDALIARHERRAVSVAYRLLGNLHDALEVCQEAFVRAYRGLDTLARPERFGSWLLRIVTNLALNRRRCRRRPAPLGESGTPPGGPAPGADVPAAGAAGRPGADLAAAELAEQVRAILAGLPEPQRAALVLFVVGQMPQREVAEILGCSVEAVKWHIFQARRKLRAALAAYLHDGPAAPPGGEPEGA